MSSSLKNFQIYQLTVFKADGTIIKKKVDYLSGYSIGKALKYDNSETSVVTTPLTPAKNNIVFKSLTSESFPGPPNVKFNASFEESGIPIYGNAAAFDSVFGAYFVDFNLETPLTPPFKIGVRSDPYPCPYNKNSSYTDIRGTFSFCIDTNPSPPDDPTVLYPSNNPPIYGYNVQAYQAIGMAGRYPLGTFAVGDLVKITLTFRFPTEALPTNFQIKVLDQGMQTVSTLAADEVIDETVKPYIFEVEWTATVNSTVNADPTLDKQHYLDVTQIDAAAIASLRIYEIVVETPAGIVVN